MESNTLPSDNEFKVRFEQEFNVDDHRRLKSWREIAKREIRFWLDNDDYRDYITRNVMTAESMGPFTKFLYHFAYQCKTGWGVMIDFNEYSQRVFLPDHYYKWMHKLRDEILEELETTETPKP